MRLQNKTITLKKCSLLGLFIGLHNLAKNVVHKYDYKIIIIIPKWLLISSFSIVKAPNFSEDGWFVLCSKCTLYK